MPVLAAATIVFALSTIALALLVEPVPTWYYHLAWWSYIAAADESKRADLTKLHHFIRGPVELALHFGKFAGNRVAATARRAENPERD